MKHEGESRKRKEKEMKKAITIAIAIFAALGGMGDDGVQKVAFDFEDVLCGDLPKGWNAGASVRPIYKGRVGHVLMATNMKAFRGEKSLYIDRRGEEQCGFSSHLFCPLNIKETKRRVRATFVMFCEFGDKGPGMGFEVFSEWGKQFTRFDFDPGRKTFKAMWRFMKDGAIKSGVWQRVTWEWPGAGEEEGLMRVEDWDGEKFGNPEEVKFPGQALPKGLAYVRFWSHEGFGGFRMWIDDFTVETL